MARRERWRTARTALAWRSMVRSGPERRARNGVARNEPGTAGTAGIGSVWRNTDRYELVRQERAGEERRGGATFGMAGCGQYWQGGRGAEWTARSERVWLGTGRRGQQGHGRYGWARLGMVGSDLVSRGLAGMAGHCEQRRVTASQGYEGHGMAGKARPGQTRRVVVRYATVRHLAAGEDRSGRHATKRQAVEEHGVVWQERSGAAWCGWVRQRGDGQVMASRGKGREGSRAEEVGSTGVPGERGFNSLYPQLDCPRLFHGGWSGNRSHQRVCVGRT